MGSIDNDNESQGRNVQDDRSCLRRDPHESYANVCSCILLIPTILLLNSTGTMPSPTFAGSPVESPTSNKMKKDKGEKGEKDMKGDSESDRAAAAYLLAPVMAPIGHPAGAPVESPTSKKMKDKEGKDKKGKDDTPSQPVMAPAGAPVEPPTPDEMDSTRSQVEPNAASTPDDVTTEVIEDSDIVEIGSAPVEAGPTEWTPSSPHWSPHWTPNWSPSFPAHSPVEEPTTLSPAVTSLRLRDGADYEAPVEETELDTDVELQDEDTVVGPAVENQITTGIDLYSNPRPEYETLPVSGPALAARLNPELTREVKSDIIELEFGGFDETSSVEAIMYSAVEDGLNLFLVEAVGDILDGFEMQMKFSDVGTRRRRMTDAVQESAAVTTAATNSRKLVTEVAFAKIMVAFQLASTDKYALLAFDHTTATATVESFFKGDSLNTLLDKMNQEGLHLRFLYLKNDPDDPDALAVVNDNMRPQPKTTGASANQEESAKEENAGGNNNNNSGSILGAMFGGIMCCAAVGGVAYRRVRTANSSEGDGDGLFLRDENGNRMVAEPPLTRSSAPSFDDLDQDDNISISSKRSIVSFPDILSQPFEVLSRGYMERKESRAKQDLEKKSSRKNPFSVRKDRSRGRGWGLDQQHGGDNELSQDNDRDNFSYRDALGSINADDEESLMYPVDL